MKRYALIGFLLSTFAAVPVLAQPGVLWHRCLGGTKEDECNAMVRTSDNGFALAGSATSADGDVSGNHGGTDAWLVQLDSCGAVKWKKCFGGTSDEEFLSIVQTTDGGYAMAGRTSSNDGQVSGNHGVFDGWVVKVDNTGALQWQKCLGGSSGDEMFSIIQTSDGGFAVCGQTNSTDGDVSGSHGSNADAWIVKLDGAGVIQWQKCLGGTMADWANCIIQTQDGGYAIAGTTYSNDGDVLGNHGGSDCWIVKIDNIGTIQWQKCLGGSSDDISYSIRQTTDGRYIVAGRAGSDISGTNGNDDAWLVKLDASGNIAWQKCYGGTSNEEAYSVIPTLDNGYAMAGYTTSTGGEVSGNHGGTDGWVIKVNSAGILQWQKCIGGTSSDQIYSIQQTSDSEFALAGTTLSNDGDASGNHGSSDAWIIKLAPLSLPTISYITPDAGAPGMCVAVEIVAPASASGSFGGDQAYVPDSIVRLTRASDHTLVRLGPAVVSWNGRLIQQMFMIEPNIKSLDTEVYFQVVVNGAASATDSFEIKAPYDFGTQSGGGVLLGASRTKRNTMVVDSMTLMNGTFVLPTTDPDPSTPGNQAYLPLRILSVGPIRLINATINASGNSGVTGTAGGNGAPGGGGGGSGYPGAGGAGYTGGGGDNDGSNGPGGVGTGSTSTTPTGGQSLNGVPGGNGELHSGGGGDDGGGGGTGLPFGTSGNNGGPSASPSGGFGAGSAGGSSGPPLYATNYGGGGGGFEASGGAGGGTGNDAGQLNGNLMLVPLAGGSGGGAGNATNYFLSPNANGGSGGGGGGAIELTSFASFSFSGNSIAANGGNGSNANSQAAGGGGGSGGAVSISARDSIVIASTASISENGGTGGSGQYSGGTGGLGRTRINGMVSKFASPSSTNYFSTSKDFTGPSIQRVTSTPDTVLVHGYAEQWDGVPGGTLPVEVHWAWPSSAVWHDTLAGIFLDPRSHTAQWSALFPNSPNPMDSEVYIVAVQDESGSSSSFVDIPSAVMSHTGGIVAKVVGQPKMLVNVTSIDFGKVHLDSCSHDTTIEIYSIGRGTLIVDSVTFNPAILDYRIKTSFPDTIPPGSSFALTLSFCPTVVKCPIATSLTIYSNASDTSVSLTGCGVQPGMIIRPFALDFGRVHIGACKDSFVVVSNPGNDTLTVSEEAIHDPRFTALDPLPIFVPPGGSTHLNLRFCPTDTIMRLANDSIIGDAPQSPFLLTLLGEGKIGVLSLPAVLDFGLVHLDSCKDSIIYATNIGNDSLILESNLISPSGFTSTLPPLPLVILPHDSVPIDIRFCSTDTGSFEAISTFTTDIPNTDTILLLAHTGIGILSIPDTIDLGAVSTGGCDDTTIFVTNIGTDTLFLASPTNLLPPFSYVGPTPLMLAPGAGDSVKFQFCPTDSIAYQENTQFDTIRPGVSPRFTLLGKGIEGALATSGAINLGCIVKGDTTVTVTIRNTGTAPLDSLTVTVIPNSVASIVHYPPATLPPGDSNSVVLIIPASNYGAISGTLSIVWRGGTPITLPITGEVTTPPKIVSLDSIITFDTTNVGDSSATQCIHVANYSCIPLQMDTALILGGLSGEFEIVSNNLGATLSDSTITAICLRYTPRRGGPASAELEIVSGKDTIPVAALSGVGLGKAVGVQLAVDTVAGRPGEIVNVPVRILNDVTSSAITSLTFRVTFNPMQLDLKSPVAPITLRIIPAHTLSTTATYSVKTYSIGDKEITANYSSPLTGTPVVAELPFEILEPTANTAAVHILSASFGASPATLSTASNGLIQIEQCDTNNHVVFSAAPIDVAQNTPNPFSRETAVTVDIRNAGHLTLEVYNALGMKVLMPFDADVAIGTQTIAIDASGLPSGAYRYITTWTGAGSPVRIEKTMVVLGE